ncbi:MAG: hypothetical protein ABJH07_05240 [Sedimentitalea sp.]|uniref:hypothetical protein n=1 Tax=Sedimentitalea sp. TaxID=2048915 RepID=UPI0032648981
MTVLAILIVLVFATSFLFTGRVGGGYYWDFGNALGFLALAGLLFQMVPYPRSLTARRHENIGYLVLAVAIAHAFWFLAGDAVVRVYLQPGAPLYMWAGLVGIISLAALSILARMPDRMRVHKRFSSFRNTHRVLGFIVVAATAHHVLLSGIYLTSWPQWVLLALIGLGACFGRQYWSRLSHPPSASSVVYLSFGSIAILLFVLVRNAGS